MSGPFQILVAMAQTIAFLLPSEETVGVATGFANFVADDAFRVS